MRLNGIGTTLLGISRKDNNNTATATVWFTFIFLPLIPLNRIRVQFTPHRGSGFSYIELEKLPLKPGGILKTYLFGWIIYPVIIFTPLIIAVNEIYTALSLPLSWYNGYTIFAIIWLPVTAMLLYGSHEKKGQVRTNETRRDNSHDH